MTDPYNSADRLMPKQYTPFPTVTFRIHQELYNMQPLPPMVAAWATSNLPDGDYVAQYRLEHDAYFFARAEMRDGKRKLVQVQSAYRLP